MLGPMSNDSSSKPCRQETEYFHESGIADDDLQDTLNRLSKDKWEGIGWEREEEKQTFIVDAHKEYCACLPNVPVQMFLLILEKIKDIDKAKKHWRTALKIYGSADTTS